MAESQDDKDVDACIAELRSALDRLEAAQRKDVDDESGESYDGKNTPVEDQPQSLRDATIKVRAHFRKARQRRDSNT